jgi:hypothetical protein
MSLFPECNGLNKNHRDGHRRMASVCHALWARGCAVPGGRTRRWSGGVRGPGSGGRGWRALGCAQCLRGRGEGEAASRTECSGCLLLNVKGTFIGMSESRRGIINGAETATSVPCDPRKTRRTIRPAANIHTESRRSKCAEESEDPGVQ